MTRIRLKNTLTRTVQDFAPIDPANVRMYVCGPTVYDRAHLGNARPVVVFDVLYRLLRHVYGADHVTYVRNFTDVDDKINAEAQRRKAAGRAEPLEALIRERTEETIAWYHADMDALGALRPDHEPRATEYIGEVNHNGSGSHMIGMIQDLIEKKFAYVVRDPSNDPPKEFVIADYERMTGETALFEVEKFDRYGRLSGRSIDDMIAGARVEVAPYKRNPMDFVLWKPSDGDLPGWRSPWGRGRPGWHIECSAMSKALLGPTFDIHGGGIDLQFPHHENEIAQSCCANGTEFMARYWLHNEMLLVEGKKMSKSLGNFFTVRDLLDQGIPGEVIRYVFLMTQYSKPMDWTRRKAAEAQASLEGMARLLGKGGQQALSSLTPTEPFPEVVEALADDLNTHLALSLLHPRRIAEKLGGGSIFEHLGSIYASQLLLGFDLKSWTSALDAAESHDANVGIIRKEVGKGPLAQLEERLAALRETAMATKDFSAVDALKSALIAAGVEVRMSKAGVELVPGPGFDPAKLEGLA